MGRTISGGFDMVLALSIPAIDATVREHLPTRTDHSWAIDVPDWLLFDWGVSATLRVGLGPVEVAPGPGDHPELAISVSAEGSQMCWEDLDVPVLGTVFEWLGLDPHVIDAGCWAFLPTVRVSAQLVGQGRMLEVDEPSVTVTLPPGTLEAVPGIAAYLALFDLIPGGRTTDEARAELYASVQADLAAGLDLLLPDTIPLAVLPLARSVRTAVAGSEVRVLLEIDSVAVPPADPATITRSVLRHPAAGSAGPTDLAAVIVGNDWLLRSTVRPAVAAGLVLADGGFLGPHPCFWSGWQSLVGWFDMEIALTQVMAQIDQAGRLCVSAQLAGRHGDGAFGMTGQARFGVGVSIGSDGVLRVDVEEPEVFGLDVWVADWVYVLAAFVPGSPLTLLAFGLIDACAGGDAAGVLTGALTGRITIPDVAVPVPSLLGLDWDLSLQQPDSEWQVATLPGPAPLPIPVSRANDVVERLYLEG